MTLLIQAAAFVLGMYLSIRMIAALYGILDFWYAMRTSYPRVLRGILGWGTAILTTAWLLERPYRRALLAGLAAFLLFYLSAYLLRYPVLRALQRRAVR